ncbi:DUF1513 domain-containing protein [Pseudomonas fluvialis]|uniref:DUF1513 domain-containing protein n=1 Tax=Pseudomonas fluvialis TaxID=1793966 RepID=UPI0035AF0599
MQRRTLLGLAAGGMALGLGGLASWQWLGGQAPLLLSARDDSQGRHYAVGYRQDGRCQFATPVAERCHDIAVHPHLPLALFVGRRPSRASYLIDTRDGRLLQTLHSAAERHFQGHAVFHGAGEWLYSCENDTAQPGRGVIGCYRLTEGRLQRVGEHSSHGVGPHQLLWQNDGETLVIANGGIRTEADSRQAMNLDAMDASLVLLQRDGQLLSHERLADQQNSIRHLAVASDGTIVCGQQFMGAAEQAVPLLAIKRPGQALRAFSLGEAQRQLMNQYTASLAIHDELRLLAVTAPRGGHCLLWDLDRETLRLSLPLADCAGITACTEGFLVSTGQGRCRLLDCRTPTPRVTPLSLPAGLWDNHWRSA